MGTHSPAGVRDRLVDAMALAECLLVPLSAPLYALIGTPIDLCALIIEVSTLCYLLKLGDRKGAWAETIGIICLYIVRQRYQMFADGPVVHDLTRRVGYMS